MTRRQIRRPDNEYCVNQRVLANAGSGHLRPLARIIHERVRQAHSIAGLPPGRDAKRLGVHFRSRSYAGSESCAPIGRIHFVAGRTTPTASTRSTKRTRYERCYPARAPKPCATWLQAFRNGNDAGKCTTILRTETTT